MNLEQQFNEIFKELPERAKQGAQDCLDNKPISSNDHESLQGWALAYEYLEKVSHEPR